MRAFQRGETVEAYAEVKTQAGVLVDATVSIKITITDPDGTKQLLDDPNYDEAMVWSATGKYVYYYNIAADAILGWWRVLVTVTDTGSKITIARDGFQVEV